jgi:hypothetical protein
MYVPMGSTDAALQAAFDDQPAILQGLKRIAGSRDEYIIVCAANFQKASAPAEAQTILQLANYVTSLKRLAAQSQVPDAENGASKKRKLVSGDSQILPEIGGSLLFSIPDISFSVPVRKKLKLEGVNGGIRGLDAAGNMEVSVAWSTIGTHLQLFTRMA